MTEFAHAGAIQSCDREVRQKRLRYLCWHRGTQEVDLIFGSFAERFLNGFSAEQLDRFEALMDCTDPDLFDWVTRSEGPPPEYDHDVMRMLRDSHCQKKG
jgi:antitoxin CptB